MRPLTSFSALYAGDIMQSDLLCLPSDLPFSEAVRRLVQHRRIGAPVVNHEGVLVGMLTSADFLRDSTTSAHVPLTYPSVYSEWQVICPEDMPQESVRDRMSRDPATALPRTPVLDLARLMIERQVHCIVIIDERRKPVGLVSSTDILSALAKYGGTWAGRPCLSEGPPSRWQGTSEVPLSAITRTATMDVGQ